MLGLLLSGAALVIAYLTGRRSLVAGMRTVLVVGYTYGILRANLLDTFTYFFADAAVVGLFAAQLFKGFSPDERRRSAGVRSWLLVLVLWPTLLLFFPIQDPLVQLVGYRGSVFLLGFIVLGSRLTEKDLYDIAVWCAWLNLAALGLAVSEFFVGIEPFFPRNTATEIMYRSKVIIEGSGTTTNYRIPSSFSNAHAYGGTMVMTTPLLLGAWVASRSRAVGGAIVKHRTVLLLGALFAAVMGVFMSATRSSAALLFVVLIAATLTVRMRPSHRIGSLLVLAVAGIVVAQDARLQRFTTLGDEEFVRARVNSSVNQSFIDYAARYPMGVGLGGGGASMPYFLANRVRSPGVIESEYGRIMLEQGIPGLLLWVGFAGWVIAQGMGRRGGPWETGRRLAWVAVSASFVTGIVGLGLFASIPQSYMFCVLIGWTVAPPLRKRQAVTAPSYLRSLGVPNPRTS